MFTAVLTYGTIAIILRVYVYIYARIKPIRYMCMHILHYAQDTHIYLIQYA